jgi:hypothetical protein
VQSGRRALHQALPRFVDEQHRAANARHDVFHRAPQAFQTFPEGCAAGDQFEYVLFFFQDLRGPLDLSLLLLALYQAPDGDGLRNAHQNAERQRNSHPSRN